LAIMLAWRAYILGGLGGYPMAASAQLMNVISAAPVLAELLWGHMWIGLPIGLAFCAVAPRLVPLAVLGWVAGLLPFVLAGPIDEPQYAPFSAARLLFVWAWLIVIGALAASRLRQTIHRKIAAAAVVIVLGVQCMQHAQINDGIARVLPAEKIAIAGDRSVALISEVSLGHAMAHLRRPRPRAPLDAYQTLPSLQLDLATGHRLADGADRLRIPASVEVPEVPPLDMEGIEMDADARGRFHLRLPESALGRLYLSWVQENDGTRWVVTLPLQRRRIDFPLNYSISKVMLSEIRLGERVWPTHVWQSPFFRDPYPPGKP
jgi:hypothetical protein